MKQLQTVLNIGFTVAVAILFYLFLSKSEVTNPPEAEATTETLSQDTTGHKSENKGTTAYVNTDTLWAKYQFVKDMQNELAAEKLKKEGQYGQRLKKFEEAYIALQEEARFLTMQQGQEKQAELEQQQQELMALEQSLQMELMKSEQKKNEVIRKKISDYLADYSSKKGYQIILGYSSISDLLYAPDSLDITSEVVEALNTAYTTQKQKATE
eukprot:gnl/MRDRNA2_/MRDRNA2_218171_c0_seq1.p1 gnl/MRDRNA2_/MRDRNA2_218171_c0~~gnl/MRDRNA2_/MRDRNA2_218171_c0_seq1.p1  ORF type:complete len:212 (+),score=16.79 gnl/MRDRNA2_/MRDRNA2_218171_c0_seq1:209-844(+)